MKKQSSISYRIVALSVLGTICPAPAQTPNLVAPFSSSYTVRRIGTPAGVPIYAQNGDGDMTALVFKAGSSNKLLVSGRPENSHSRLYEVTLLRDAAGHVTNFTGTATEFATATGMGDSAYLGRSLSYGPGNVLFYTSEDGIIGQLKPGATSPSKLINPDDLGKPAPGTHGSVGFVPTGFPGAGRCKISDVDGGWSDVALVADGTGAYNLGTVSLRTTLSAAGVMTFVAAGGPQFPTASVVMLQQPGDAAALFAYNLNASGDPVAGSGRLMLTNMVYPYGITTDPVTGDLLFSHTSNDAGEPTAIWVIASVSRPAPVVSLTAPANNSRAGLRQIVPVTASASVSGGTIEQVRFYRNDLLMETLSAPPYTASYLTESPGVFVFRAVAASGGIQGTSAPVTLTVTNRPPVAWWTNTPDHQLIRDCSPFTLRGDGYDPDEELPLTSLSFYNHRTNLLGTATSRPYRLSVSTFGAATNFLTVVATDRWGGQATSAVLTVRVVLPPANTMGVAAIGTTNLLLCYRGRAGNSYVWEYTDQLLTPGPTIWRPFATNLAPAVSYGEFSIPARIAPGVPARFYRVRR